MEWLDVRAYLNGDPTMRDQGGRVIPKGDAIQVLDRWDRVVGTLTMEAGEVCLEDREGPLASAPWAYRDSVFEEAIGLVIESGMGR